MSLRCNDAPELCFALYLPTLGFHFNHGSGDLAFEAYLQRSTCRREHEMHASLEMFCLSEFSDLCRRSLPSYLRCRVSGGFVAKLLSETSRSSRQWPPSITARLHAPFSAPAELIGGMKIDFIEALFIPRMNRSDADRSHLLLSLYE